MTASRTEQPTPKRLREARRRGEVARSPELSGAAGIAGGVAAVLAAGPAAVAELAAILRRGAAFSAGGALPDAAQVARAGIAAVLRLSAVPMLAALASAALAAALQSGLHFSGEAMGPRLDRLDPLQGLRRAFGPSQLARAALSLGKAAVLLAVLCHWLGSEGALLARLPLAGSHGAWRALSPLGALCLRLAAALAVFGALDWALERRRHRRALMMTRDEVRRERKEDEGDPAHRAERRRLHRALLEASPVSRATVVLVNPTRLAVALRHDREGDGAPRVVAKGTGREAARIRSTARRAGVPIVRDVALARALFRLAEVGDEIPEELYEAAAAVLAHLYGAEAR